MKTTEPILHIDSGVPRKIRILLASDADIKRALHNCRYFNFHFKVSAISIASLDVRLYLGVTAYHERHFVDFIVDTRMSETDLCNTIITFIEQAINRLNDKLYSA